LVLALAWDWIVLAVDISILHALASVASISFVEGSANLDGSAVVVARADFVVADDVGVVVALAGLAPIQMGDTGFSNGVLLSVVVAFTLLGVASDHAGLEASTSVASVGVDPGKSDSVFLSGISEAEADFVLTRDLSVCLAGARVALVQVGSADCHWLVGHRVSAANPLRANHHARLGIAGARVSARVSGRGEGLAWVVLHSVVGAFAVDAVVRDEVSSVLRAGESGATIGGSHDLTNFDHSSLVRAPTGHISTTNGSRLSTRASVTILWEGLADGISDAIMDARTLVL